QRDADADFVKVLDFGIAKHFEEPKRERLTRPNIALGTPEYMAPEQVSGRAEPRSDIYAVGAMLYEMLVGAPPFEGENYLEVLRRKALDEPTPQASYALMCRRSLKRWSCGRWIAIRR